MDPLGRILYTQSGWSPGLNEVCTGKVFICWITVSYSQDRSPTDDLLTSVRSELDKSIARHLDSG